MRTYQNRNEILEQESFGLLNDIQDVISGYIYWIASIIVIFGLYLLLYDFFSKFLEVPTEVMGFILILSGVAILVISKNIDKKIYELSHKYLMKQTKKSEKGKS